MTSGGEAKTAELHGEDGLRGPGTLRRPETAANTVRLDYWYQAPHEEDTFSEPVDHGKLRRSVTKVFENEACSFLESGIAKAEGCIKDEHKTIQEVNISVTIQWASS